LDSDIAQSEVWSQRKAQRIADTKRKTTNVENKSTQYDTIPACNRQTI